MSTDCTLRHFAVRRVYNQLAHTNIHVVPVDNHSAVKRGGYTANDAMLFAGWLDGRFFRKWISRARFCCIDHDLWTKRHASSIDLTAWCTRSENTHLSMISIGRWMEWLSVEYPDLQRAILLYIIRHYVRILLLVIYRKTVDVRHYHLLHGQCLI